MYVANDLWADTTMPIDKVVVATLAESWFGDGLMRNTVSVQNGVNGQVHVKLADGSFNPPPRSSSKLAAIAATGGLTGYTLTSVNGDQYRFRPDGNVEMYTAANGHRVWFTYTGSDLTKVENALGRVLNLVYVGGFLSSVNDGNGRSGELWRQCGRQSADLYRHLVQGNQL